jgi:membrane protease YdiL (CAAX protease family)
MNPAWKPPLLGVLAAIAVTTSMDATGLTAFSALPLFPLIVAFCYLQHLSPTAIGFTWGRWRYFGIAVLYPLLVLGTVALICLAAGAVSISSASWRKTLLNIALVTISTALVATLTEEGFFRGWLWASLQRAGRRQLPILLWSSGAFALWHLSWVTLTVDKLPLAQIPVFIANAAVIGSIWGLMRWMSGSVLVASVSHGLWNGLTYVLFGFGTKVGALGIANTAIFGPEVGILGLAANVLFAAALYALWRAAQPAIARAAKLATECSAAEVIAADEHRAPPFAGGNQGDV